MTATRLEPFFLDGEAGRIFMILRAPSEAHHCVLFVPPFGEEMNKCRRQFSLTAQSLNKRGYGALLIDLYGTGDSDGDFSQADWDIWISDIGSALQWAQANGLSVNALVATRLGCQLAAEGLRRHGHAVGESVFWQPTANGKQYLTQFLRLRVAASMMETDQKETVKQLRGRLAAGETVEVAGYPLTDRLTNAIDKLDLLGSLTPNLGELLVCEVGRSGGGELSPGGKRLLAGATEAGLSVSGRRILGEPFWSATEIVTNSDLVAATIQFVSPESTDG